MIFKQYVIDDLLTIKSYLFKNFKTGFFVGFPDDFFALSSKKTKIYTVLEKIYSPFDLFKISLRRN